MQRGASSPLGFLLRSGSFFSPVGSTSEMGLFAGPVMTASEGAGEDCVAVRLRSAISCMAVEASILPSLYISTRRDIASGAQVRGSTATHGEEKHLQEKKVDAPHPTPLGQAAESEDPAVLAVAIESREGNESKECVGEPGAVAAGCNPPAWTCVSSRVSVSAWLSSGTGMTSFGASGGAPV